MGRAAVTPEVWVLGVGCSDSKPLRPLLSSRNFVDHPPAGFGLLGSCPGFSLAPWGQELRWGLKQHGDIAASRLRTTLENQKQCHSTRYSIFPFTCISWVAERSYFSKGRLGSVADTRVGRSGSSPGALSPVMDVLHPGPHLAWPRGREWGAQV